MNTPLLQIALDVQNTTEAIKIVETILPAVDVVEAGTILCVAEGVAAVRELRAAFPSRTLLADIKLADAGSTLAAMCAKAGADWVTIICCAEIATIEVALQTMKKERGDTGDAQIELYGNWSWDEAELWKRAGIIQVVYHRSRDAQAAGKTWTNADLQKIQKLSDMGFAVSVTGGLTTDDIPLFKGMTIKSFIAGRALTSADNPLKAAEALKNAIAKFWS